MQYFLAFHHYLYRTITERSFFYVQKKTIGSDDCNFPDNYRGFCSCSSGTSFCKPQRLNFWLITGFRFFLRKPLQSTYMYGIILL